MRKTSGQNRISQIGTAVAVASVLLLTACAAEPEGESERFVAFPLQSEAIDLAETDLTLPLTSPLEISAVRKRIGEGQVFENVYHFHHVQGYLRFWDDLLARNPGLWIDSCASGGRRNDLETMRRSVPLHYTDYGYGDHPVKLAFHRTLYEWIPYFKECTLSWDLSGPGRFDSQADSYSFHCGLAAMLFATVDIRRDDNPCESFQPAPSSHPARSGWLKVPTTRMTAPIRLMATGRRPSNSATTWLSMAAFWAMRPN